MVNLRKILLLGSTLSVLNGCAVVAVGAVGAVAATGAAVATDPRTGGSVVDDKTIQTKLALKYGETDSFPDSNIYVDVYSSEVLLTGQVKTKELRGYAENVARGYPGVVKVYNHLDIRLPSSAKARSTDTLITLQLKTQLFGTSNVSSNNIKIETTNSIVYMMGVVTPLEAESATAVASKVGGVAKVITFFHYKAATSDTSK